MHWLCAELLVLHQENEAEEEAGAGNDEVGEEVDEAEDNDDGGCADDAEQHGSGGPLLFAPTVLSVAASMDGYVI